MSREFFFETSKKDFICNDTMLYVFDFEFWSHVISFNKEDKQINYYSDEWIHLINYNYSGHMYEKYYDVYCSLNNTKTAATIIDKDCVQLFTTFSRGSVHGFSGFYYTLIKYVRNLHIYRGLHVLLYKEMQQGMLDIIEYLCDKGWMDKSKIIFIEKEKLYCVKTITYIPNEYHVFMGELIGMADEFIRTFLLAPSMELYPARVCLVKTANTNNISDNGFIQENVLNDFCEKWGIVKLNTSNEIQLINYIANCELLVITYGSAFFKNFIYIGDKCRKIIVLVNGHCYIHDYNHLSSIVPNRFQGIILKNYKNAVIEYVVNNESLNFFP